jgi:competence protein ComEC
VLVWSAFLEAPDGLLHVAFLDVGQGDSAMVVTPTGRTVLIDGGSDGQRTCLLVDQFLPYWDRSIDAVVMTHPHADHLGGLLAVADRYEVGLVLCPGIGSESLLYTEWERRAERFNAVLEIATAGQVLALGDGTTLTVLNPEAGAPTEGLDADDNGGVVLRLDYGDVSVLFAADIRAQREATLVHGGAALRANVLKVPHHGSDTSSSEQFITAVNPEVAVISVGSQNAYGHPHAAVIAALADSGATVLATSACGTVEFVTDGRELNVRTDRLAQVSTGPTDP